jgi:hypothetical protein
VASRNALVTLSVATAALALVLMSLGAYYMGVAVVDMDPADSDNYESASAAADPAEQRALKGERGQTATNAWILITLAGALGVGALWAGLLTPSKEHQH